jgi:threonine dehydratase
MSNFVQRAKASEAEMRALFEASPLQRNAHLSEMYDADIWLKREDLTPVRSYKIRGAFNAIRKCLAQTPDQQLFVAASAGNHAQGVAYVCKHFGRRGVIFMPVTTPRQKIDKTRIFGGDAIEIVLVGDYFDSTLAAARAYCDEKCAHFLSPFDDPDVIEGQASVAVEMMQQLGATPDVIVLPVGGGGLSSGVTAYMTSEGSDADLYFVEPKGGANLTAALEARVPVALEHVDTFVDGAAVGQIGDATFEVLKKTPLDRVIRIAEDRICTTMLDMLNTEGVVLEPAGALALDALKDIADDIRGKRVVCIASGGNFDFERLPEVKERAQRSAGLKKYYILRMPQRPGALKDFLNMLGPSDDIARFEYLKKSARNFGSVLIGIETADPSSFTRLTKLMENGGFGYRDITNDGVLAEFLI